MVRRSLAGFIVTALFASHAWAGDVEKLNRVYGTSALTFIYEKPDVDSAIYGAIHGGQSVAIRDAKPTDGPGCGVGYYAVEPRGFICPERTATTSPSERAFLAAREVLPDFSSSVPMRYGISKGAPRYLRLPHTFEQESVEPEALRGRAQIDTSIEASPSLRIHLRSQTGALTAEQDAFEGFKVAWTKEIQEEDRAFVVTPDLVLIPKDRIAPATSPTLSGVNLRDTPMEFPIGFLWLGDAPVFERKDGKMVESARVLARHAFVEVTGKMRTYRGKLYSELRTGEFIRQDTHTLIKPYRVMPFGFGAEDKWISVRITHGFFVAYEGLRPVYVGAMSPGIDGVSNRPHATPRGRFIVRAKRASVMMDGNDRGKYWRVDDVPFTQFFKGSLALHGAWWHNDFGRPKSHGCVNLAPTDALWLWGWTDPVLPADWYVVQAVYPDVPSTKIVIRP